MADLPDRLCDRVDYQWFTATTRWHWVSRVNKLSSLHWWQLTTGESALQTLLWHWRHSPLRTTRRVPMTSSFVFHSAFHSAFIWKFGLRISDQDFKSDVTFCLWFESTHRSFACPCAYRLDMALFGTKKSIIIFSDWIPLYYIEPHMWKAINHRRSN